MSTRIRNAVLIALLSAVPSFIAGWVTGVHGGFETGAKVSALEIRNAMKEGIRDRMDFFIRDFEDIKFHPVGSGEVSVCFSDGESRAVKMVKTLEWGAERN